MSKQNNYDEFTVKSFGNEWTHFNQSSLSSNELKNIFDKYFSIFPWDQLPENAEGFDMGSGSGRWAKGVAPKVGKLNCIDPSSALEVSKKNLELFPNIEFFQSTANDKVLPSLSQDFGYSLGVLHHVPDTQSALNACVDMLKPGAPFLLYLYYRFDNKPLWFRLIWLLSEIPRAIISRMPNKLKPILTTPLAMIVYWPLARVSKLLEKFGISVKHIPLSAYRNLSFYTMRTDSRDRFGTPLEHRFTRVEISKMMESAGLRDCIFSDSSPYWVSLGYKSEQIESK